MATIETLLHRIDEELATEVERQKAAWREGSREAEERGPRLARYEALANHLIELLKPRLAAFIDRFKAVVKAEPRVLEHTRAIRLSFAATVVKVTLTFKVFPDRDVSHLRLECNQEIIPVVVRYGKQSVLEFPLDAVDDDAAVQWFDERLVTFVKTYLAVVRQARRLTEELKDQFVEDPVAKVRFPKYLAASTLERDGRTYYFVDEDTRQAFERQPEAK
jgi:YHS domain-containing protein